MISNANARTVLTGDFKVGPLLRRPTEVVNILDKIAAAGHDELVAAFLCVAAGIEFYGQVDGAGDVHLVLRAEHTAMTELACH